MLVVYIFHKNEIKVLKRLLKIKFLGDCTGYLLKKGTSSSSFFSDDCY